MASFLKKQNKFLSKIAYTPKNQKCFVVFAVLSVATMVAIFCFSAQSADDSKALSTAFSGGLEAVLNALKWLVGEALAVWIKTYVRKIAHFTLYALLGAFVSATFLNTKIKAPAVKYLMSAGVCLFYSITDEFHQLFIDGRSGELSDVLIDFCGAVTGILLTALFYKIICIFSKRPKKY